MVVGAGREVTLDGGSTDPGLTSGPAQAGVRIGDQARISSIEDHRDAALRVGPLSPLCICLTHRAKSISYSAV